MTKERFKEIKSIVEEIDELEKFIPVFKEAWNENKIMATERKTDSLGHDKDIFFCVGRKSELNKKILSALEERLKELKDLLDKA